MAQIRLGLTLPVVAFPTEERNDESCHCHCTKLIYYAFISALLRKDTVHPFVTTVVPGPRIVLQFHLLYACRFFSVMKYWNFITNIFFYFLLSNFESETLEFYCCEVESLGLKKKA